MCVHPTHIRPFPYAVMRLLPLFLCLIAVQADTQVLPSNNSVSTSSDFRIWGSSHLDGQQLAPLTQSLLQLTDAQQKVRGALNDGFLAPSR